MSWDFKEQKRRSLIPPLFYAEFLTEFMFAIKNKKVLAFTKNVC